MTIYIFCKILYNYYNETIKGGIFMDTVNTMEQFIITTNMLKEVLQQLTNLLPNANTRIPRNESDSNQKSIYNTYPALLKANLVLDAFQSSLNTVTANWTLLKPSQKKLVLDRLQELPTDIRNLENEARNKEKQYESSNNVELDNHLNNVINILQSYFDTNTNIDKNLLIKTAEEIENKANSVWQSTPSYTQPPIASEAQTEHIMKFYHQLQSFDGETRIDKDYQDIRQQRKSIYPTVNTFYSDHLNELINNDRESSVRKKLESYKQETQTLLSLYQRVSKSDVTKPQWDILQNTIELLKNPDMDVIQSSLSPELNKFYSWFKNTNVIFPITKSEYKRTLHVLQSQTSKKMNKFLADCTIESIQESLKNINELIETPNLYLGYLDYSHCLDALSQTFFYSRKHLTSPEAVEEFGEIYQKISDVNNSSINLSRYPQDSLQRWLTYQINALQNNLEFFFASNYNLLTIDYSLISFIDKILKKSVSMQNLHTDAAKILSFKPEHTDKIDIKVYDQKNDFYLSINKSALKQEAIWGIFYSEKNDPSSKFSSDTDLFITDQINVTDLMYYNLLKKLKQAQATNENGTNPLAQDFMLRTVYCNNLILWGNRSAFEIIQHDDDLTNLGLPMSLATYLVHRTKSAIRILDEFYSKINALTQLRSQPQLYSSTEGKGIITVCNAEKTQEQLRRIAAETIYFLQRVLPNIDTERFHAENDPNRQKLLQKLNELKLISQKRTQGSNPQDTSKFSNYHLENILRLYKNYDFAIYGSLNLLVKYEKAQSFIKPSRGSDPYGIFKQLYTMEPTTGIQFLSPDAENIAAIDTSKGTDGTEFCLVASEKPGPQKQGTYIYLQAFLDIRVEDSIDAFFNQQNFPSLAANAPNQELSEEEQLRVMAFVYHLAKITGEDSVALDITNDQRAENKYLTPYSKMLFYQAEIFQKLSNKAYDQHAPKSYINFLEERTQQANNIFHYASRQYFIPDNVKILLSTRKLLTAEQITDSFQPINERIQSTNQPQPTSQDQATHRQPITPSELNNQQPTKVLQPVPSLRTLRKLHPKPPTFS